MKVLMILTSHDRLGDTGKKTGFWLEEFAAPYYVLLDAGAEITLASPAGGQPPLDPQSDVADAQTEATEGFKRDDAAQSALGNTKKLAQIDADGFDAIFFPGGHGPLWDLAKNADSPHWRGNTDPAVWSVRRLYAMRVPGALNLNIHFHMLLLDGVYVDRLDGSIDMARIRDKIVIVGPTSARNESAMLTPTGQPISATLASAHTVSSLLNNEQYRRPEWGVWVQRGLILAVGLYLMLALGRFRTNTAFFLSLLLVLMVFNTRFLLMPAVAMLLLGQLLLGTRQVLNARLQGLLDELSGANRQLGMALQAQGHLDQAFEKYRHCRVDDSLLGQAYNLGLDCERKRQFNKAGAVFKFISQQNPEYNDVSERIEQNQ